MTVCFTQGCGTRLNSALVGLVKPSGNWSCYFVCCLRGWIFFTHLTVLVHSGCYNEIPQTRWLKSNRNLFLTVLEVRTSKIRVCQLGDFDVLMRALFLVHSCCHLLAVSSQGGRSEVALWSLFYKGTNPIYESSTDQTLSLIHI